MFSLNFQRLARFVHLYSVIKLMDMSDRENCGPAPLGPTAAAYAKSFAEFSVRAAKIQQSFHKYDITRILREDIVRCLEQAARAKLTTEQLAVLPRCFALDGPSTISWDEFNTGLAKFNAETCGCSPPIYTTRSRSRLLAARRKGLGLQGANCVTSSQEIGRYSGLAAGTDDSQSGAARQAALKGTDVTKGGEGRSLMSYYGPQLGRSL